MSPERSKPQVDQILWSGTWDEYSQSLLSLGASSAAVKTNSGHSLNGCVEESFDPFTAPLWPILRKGKATS